ncbi:phosphotriesterase family protein [Pseudonocardia spinosispora]|uniref:phosphotriesterase family protein n=1 Tax=Pseudonocardia spinosispora TaxID=103441 RepID=UPI000425F0AD|nr:phosphotriesterase [Pseudonocardia spinosispora]
MSTVRTVLGDVAPEQLGVTDAHDHLFLRMPRLAGEELDDQDAAIAELAAFRDAGGDTVIHWTPHGLGRRAGDLVAVSEAAGAHVVAATGLHQEAHYDPQLLAGLRSGLAELFVTELTEGIEGEGPATPRAGMIKVAGDFHSLSRHTRWVMTAAAEAHRETGATIGVHLERGTAAALVVDLLCVRLGVPPAKVVLGHLNRSPDLGMYHEVAAAGVFLAFDGPSRANHESDWRLFESLVALAEFGCSDRLLFGGDTTTASARAATDGGPGMPYLLSTMRPRLTSELGEDVVRRMMVTNPARAFANDWR